MKEIWNINLISKPKIKDMKNLIVAILTIIAIVSCNPTTEVKNIDLKARDIIFTGTGFDAANQDWEGEVTIKGYIVNIGTDDFISSSGQQNISIAEYSEDVAVVNFTRLNAGDTLWVSYTRNWNQTTEFAPDYHLWINYDPDISIDGNTDNNDLNSGNNHIFESGQQMNQL